jgi:ABC-type transporter Mla subunit MlaD
MISKAAKIRLGVFVTAGTGLLVLFFAVVAGNRLVERRDVYYIQFSNYSVTGLQVGGAVNYQGIRVGRVDEIKIDPKDVTKIIITVSLDSGTPIKEDTEAVLTLVGITGIKAVEIRGGSNEARLMKPGSFIRSGKSMIDDISGRAVSIADKIDQIASNISNLTDEENRRNMADILRQTSLLLADTRSNLATTLQSLNRIAANTAEVTAGLGDNITRLTDNVTKNLDSISTSATRTIGSLGDDTSRNLDSLTTATIASIEELTSTLNKELSLISANLNQSISDINSQTTALIEDTNFYINNIGSHSDAMILETTKQITEISMNLNSSLDRINQLLASQEFDNLIANVNALSTQLMDANVKGLVGELQTTISKAGTLITNIDRTLIRNRANLTETLESLREASENLNEFSRQISDQPSLLLRGN